jgi:long-subunit acyl-CoA synthetase (AMP-forming)
LACLLFGFVVVPMHKTLSTSDIDFIIEKTKMNCVICSNSVSQLFLNLNSSSSLKTIISWDSFLDEKSNETKSKIPKFLTNLLSNKNEKQTPSNGINQVNFSTIEKDGEKSKEIIQWTKEPESLCCLLSSSGSTGTPKLMMISHNAFLNVRNSKKF